VESHGAAPVVLAAIAQTARGLRAAATRADQSIRGRAFNSGKIPDQHAIIPTATAADSAALTWNEQHIYGLIGRKPTVKAVLR